MPEFTVTAEITLYTEITPEGSFRGLPDLNDVSNFYTGEGVTFVGEVTFDIEADDEETATEEGQTLVGSSVSFNDYNGIEWSIEEINIVEVERITPEMNIDLALHALTQWLARINAGSIVISDDFDLEALKFLVDYATHVRHQELSRLSSTVAAAAPGPPGIIRSS
jgi:hypothetical protein